MEIIKQIAKLIDVKSIVTITFTIVLAQVVLDSVNMSDNVFGLFSNALMLILGFFFGKKTE